MIFPSIRRSFQKRKYVIFLDIGEILEKGVHESRVCDTGVYRFPNFHIIKQFPFQIPYNLNHFFQFSITSNNSILPFQFPYPSIFATCYPFPEIFTSFPQTVPTLPFIRGTCKVRNEIETKRNRTKRNEIKQNETKPNETKCNETNCIEKNRNEIKQNETKPNETDRNEM